MFKALDENFPIKKIYFQNQQENNGIGRNLYSVGSLNCCLFNLLPLIWLLPADGGLAPRLEDEAAVQAGEVLTVESPPQAARILNLGTDFNSSPR